jgi:xylose isomerase
MKSTLLTWTQFGLSANPFPEVTGAIQFGGMGCADPLSFGCYNPDEVIMGKTMAEYLPFCGCAWHGKENPLNDMFGSGTALPLLPESVGESFEAYEVRLRAFFYMLYLLGIRYWAWHDFDLVPKGDNLREFHDNIDKMLPVILELQELTGIQCGWTTQNLFSFEAYCEGAATSPWAESYSMAVAQTKKMLEVGKAIGAKNHVFWGGREGYNQLLTTMMGEEQDRLAQFLTGAVNYACGIGFTAQFLIEPKPAEPSAHQYDASASVVMNFLQMHGLEDHFKINLETNHATLAGLTMFHECMVATNADMLGGIDVNEGTPGNGWDTDEFLSDPWVAFGIMYAILTSSQGLGSGVLNFDAKRRRGSFAPIDHILAHILGMDIMAWGLRTAAIVIEEGKLRDLIDGRYRSWSSELADVIAGNDWDEIAEAGYSTPFGVLESRSAHHEMAKSIVLRAMMRASLQPHLPAPLK